MGGAGFSFNGSTSLLGSPFNWTAGAEAFRERTDCPYSEGTTARRRVNTPGYDRTCDFNSVSAFTEMEATFSPLLRPTFDSFPRYDGRAAVANAGVVAPRLPGSLLLALAVLVWAWRGLRRSEKA